MSAEDVWSDARLLAGVLRKGGPKTEREVRLKVPLINLVSVLDELSRDELVFLQTRIQERLAS